MKKALSLFLACLMIMSCFGVSGYAAEEEGSILDDVLSPVNFNALMVPSDESQFNNFRYTKTVNTAYGPVVDYTGTLSGGNSDTGYTDFLTLIPDGVINDANIFGFSVNDLYNTSGALNWNTINYIVKDEATGVETVINSYSTFSLARAYTNRYLKTKFVERFGEQGSVDLYTIENFITITDFIGNLVNPNYKNLKPADVDVAYTTDKDFYSGVAAKSGLRDIIANNWCNRPDLNYKAVLTLLQFDYNDEDMLGESKIYNADRVSRTLVRSVVKRLIQQGPLDYILSVIGTAAPYYEVYAPAIIALFTPQINARKITEVELQKIDGLINLVINGNNPKDISKLQLFALPTEKIQSTYVNGSVDKTKLYTIFMLYFNMAGKWTTGSRPYTYFNGNTLVTEKVAVNNPAVANSYINKTKDAGIASIYKAFLKADFAEYLSLLTDESAKHMEEVKNPGASAGNFLKNYFASILKFFADIFAKIYNSFKNFGDF